MLAPATSSWAPRGDGSRSRRLLPGRPHRRGLPDGRHAL